MDKKNPDFDAFMAALGLKRDTSAVEVSIAEFSDAMVKAIMAAHNPEVTGKLRDGFLDVLTRLQGEGTRISTADMTVAGVVFLATISADSPDYKLHLYLITEMLDRLAHLPQETLNEYKRGKG